MAILTSERLIDALRALDSEERALITLFVAYSLTDAEIGAVMGLSSEAIARQRSEALARLGEVLNFDEPRSGAVLRAALLALSSDDWDAATGVPEPSQAATHAEPAAATGAAAPDQPRGRRFRRRTAFPTVVGETRVAEGEVLSDVAPASERRSGDGPAEAPAAPLPAASPKPPRGDRGPLAVALAVATAAGAAALGLCARRGRSVQGARGSARLRSPIRGGGERARSG